MKLALVTTPPSLHSGIGDYTRHLLPHLRAHSQVELYVEDGREGESLDGLAMRPVRDLRAREFDQIVYQLGNEVAHAFMEPVVRRLGGTVVLHDWVLFDLALAAHPALARGGLKGLALAWREGGGEQAQIYVRHWLARRRQRRSHESAQDPRALAGSLLDGWHALEPDGRWTAEFARARLGEPEAQSVRVVFSSEAGRQVSIAVGERRAQLQLGVRAVEHELQLDLRGLRDPILEVRTSPCSISAEQRKHGDTRTLGAFVRRILVHGERGERELDLSAPAARPAQELQLSRERFRLSLNRSIVRFGDAFITHSQFVKQRLLHERNAPTPIAVVRHGAQPRWSDEDRRQARERLGLQPDWREAFLITSFGSVQPHKRIEPMLRAFALARRERADLRLCLIGAQDREMPDVAALAREMGVESALVLTGRVDEPTAWAWIHAGDLALQLRGPSTGGSSGGVFQSLALGRGVIASDLDEQRELPEDAVLRVTTGAGEIEALSRLLLELAADPARRARLEAGARRFVESECSWKLIAERYAQALASFPRARASRLPLWRQTQAR